MFAGAGDKEVEVALGGTHLVGALPDEESVKVLPQGSQHIDVLARHSLVEQHLVTNGGVSSGPADNALEA